jgi:hypothetical protein
MYENLVKEDFMLEDDDLNVYQNIKKSGLYVVAARPTLMQYNNAKKWVFSHLDKGMSTY